ncbi:hypothetical protein B0H66DRAFT_305784 [Apodospora peruviana]|uniref:NmrA-like domain-containing protein n=1 Tax=Apodospora peruviana TaxID=516989 RepID=A0AAE0I369_9PEZI|nr:hypothetical protein B0H66DRAFT_305784 [Apodospora peruviana]
MIKASGNLGPAILNGLRTAQPPFKSITVLTRTGSNTTTTYPSDITIKQVDYSSPESLISALTGINALISAVPARSAPAQKLIIDAAVAAGVKSFVPSEFGLDSTNAALNKDFAGLWTSKVEIQTYLAELKSAGKIDYALIFTGLFLDWGLDGFLVDVYNKTVELWDGGDTVLSLTTRASIAKAVVGVLSDQSKTEEVYRIKDINLSQRRLFELAKRAVGEEEWAVACLDTETAYERFKESLKAGRPDGSYAFLKRAISIGGHGSLWSAEEDDSQVFGLREWTEEDVVELIRGAVARE